MDSITIKTPAKVNITLDVVGKRLDDYHEVRMIMEMVDLWDLISITKSYKNKDIIIETNSDKIPRDSTNIAHSAANLMMEGYGIDAGVNIYIDKKIPVAAGLAGGSTNAAGVLMGMNQLFNLDIPQQQLMKLGLRLGADVPYCIAGGTVLAEGIGERLTFLPEFPKSWVVLSKIDADVSTASVYRALDINNISKRPDTQGAIEGIKNGDLNLIAKSMHNVLEEVTIRNYPQILEIEELMIREGSLKAMMSGSGPTIFGIFNDHNKAVQAYNILRNKVKDTFLVQTL